MIEQLELEVKELVERAQQAEATEAKKTFDIPAELAGGENQVAALKEARRIIGQRRRDMLVSFSNLSIS